MDMDRKLNPWPMAGQIAAWLALFGGVVAWGLKVDERDTKQHAQMMAAMSAMRAEIAAYSERVKTLEETVKPGVLKVAASKLQELERRVDRLDKDQ